MKNNEVKVKVFAASVTDYDKRLKDKKLESPAKTGLEFSGEIISIGHEVKDYRIGDKVYGYMNFWKGDKTHNEFINVPSDYMYHKPQGITHAEAASIPVGMLTVLRALRDLAKLKAGQHILINGASGGVGVYAVQVARNLGAKVTATCSGANVSFVKELGADHVLDYKKINFLNGTGEAYDMIFDVANNTTFSKCKRLLKTNGIYITTNPLKDLQGYVQSMFSGKKSRYLMVSHGDSQGLREAAHMVDSGLIIPVIDRTFSFHQATEAYQYYSSGSKRGRVILNITASR